MELLYIQGDWNLVTLPAVAVVGTRKPTAKGLERTEALARRLVNDGFTVVSGLVEGVDTAAHQAAIAARGRTIGVIGTPLGRVYPKANAALQEQIARDHLLISQVPVLRYDAQDFQNQREAKQGRELHLGSPARLLPRLHAGWISATRERLNQSEPPYGRSRSSGIRSNA